MKKIKYLLIIVLSFLFISNSLPVLASPTSTSYGLKETLEADETLKEAFMVDEVENQSAKDFLSSRIGTVLSMVLSFLGVLFLILIIFGGIKWMIAAGNNEKVEKAKNMIISAVVGLIIVFSAYALTAFIGSALTS